MSRPEFSRRVPLNRIGAHGLEQEIEASDAERLALAARLQIPAVISLRCRYRLAAPLGGVVEAQGELRAEVTQVCVVTMEPFEAVVLERFTLRFVPEGTEDDGVDPEAPDELPYLDDGIDLGETAAEQLALGLDPYPRQPGLPSAALTEADAAAGLAGDPGAELAGTGRPHPFAALARRGPGDSGSGNDA
ncbi:YceD family protein [Lichenicoccus sp.]|uniref:YceD family protein n=1 Tax=Lichenicoccus sp. TaxID=2781899 RepID=UPI003D0C1A3B